MRTDHCFQSHWYTWRSSRFNSGKTQEGSTNPLQKDHRQDSLQRFSPVLQNRENARETWKTNRFCQIVQIKHHQRKGHFYHFRAIPRRPLRCQDSTLAAAHSTDRPDLLPERWGSSRPPDDRPQSYWSWQAQFKDSEKCWLWNYFHIEARPILQRLESRSSHPNLRYYLEASHLV